MKILIQRVSHAGVTIEGHGRKSINRGLLAFVGITHTDTPDTALLLAQRTLALRIFPDARGNMNHSVLDIEGDILVISQFTLYANTHKGNRPSFVQAAPPDQACELYETYIAALRTQLGPDHIQTGLFGAHMDVDLVNDGPVTIELERD